MLTDLYRDIARYLMPEVVSTNFDAGHVALRELPWQLLESIHTQVLQIWPINEAEKARLAVIKAYDDWHAKIKPQIAKEYSH